MRKQYIDGLYGPAYNSHSLMCDRTEIKRNKEDFGQTEISRNHLLPLFIQYTCSYSFVFHNLSAQLSRYVRRLKRNLVNIQAIWVKTILLNEHKNKAGSEGPWPHYRSFINSRNCGGFASSSVAKYITVPRARLLISIFDVG